MTEGQGEQPPQQEPEGRENQSWQEDPVWDKLNKYTENIFTGRTEEEIQEIWELFRIMFDQHVRDTLPPELRKVADEENIDPPDSEIQPGVQERLAIVKSTNTPQTNKQIASDHEKLVDVQSEMKQWEKQNQSPD
jgi:hypothetical protein